MIVSWVVASITHDLRNAKRFGRSNQIAPFWACNTCNQNATMSCECDTVTGHLEMEHEQSTACKYACDGVTFLYGKVHCYDRGALPEWVVNLFATGVCKHSKGYAWYPLDTVDCCNQCFLELYDDENIVDFTLRK